MVSSLSVPDQVRYGTPMQAFKGLVVVVFFWVFVWNIAEAQTGLPLSPADFYRAGIPGPSVTVADTNWDGTEDLLFGTALFPLPGVGLFRVFQMNHSSLLDVSYPGPIGATISGPTGVFAFRRGVGLPQDLILLESTGNLLWYRNGGSAQMRQTQQPYALMGPIADLRTYVPLPYLTSSYQINSFEAFDLNGDRADDLVFCAQIADFLFGHAQPVGLFIALSDGRGGFRSLQRFPLSGNCMGAKSEDRDQNGSKETLFLLIDRTTGTGISSEVVMAQLSVLATGQAAVNMGTPQGVSMFTAARAPSLWIVGIWTGTESEITLLGEFISRG